MRILITGNKAKKDFYENLNLVTSYINNTTNWNVLVDKDLLVENISNKYLFYSFDERDHFNIDGYIDTPDDFDLIVSLGGDGSILSIVRKMKYRQIPILGIHIGNLGFLNHCNLSNFKRYIDIIAKSNLISFKEHILISASLESNDTLISINALNDIVINQKDIPRILNLDVYVDGILLNTFNADGIIFATPLGSTAYSLSSGGPIISPDVNCIILTPISPHALSTRPIVLNSNTIIEVYSVNSKSPISVSFDGQETHSIFGEQSVCIKTTKNTSAKFIYTGYEDCYYKKLRNKLGW